MSTSVEREAEPARYTASAPRPSDESEPLARGWAAPAWAAPLLVALLAVAGSATSLANGFAYDDVEIVANNGAVHSLHGLWRVFGQPYWPPPNDAGLYRPLTTVGYALQWALGGGAPWVFHLTSVLAYAAVSVVVLLLLAELLPRRAALVGAALFAVHPVHVEAVANVVGQAEVVGALWVLLAVLTYVRARRAGPLRAPAVALLALLYAGACLTKEHGVLLLPLLVLAELTVVEDERPWRERGRSLAPAGATLAAVLAAFLVAWESVPDASHGSQLTATLLKYDWSVRLMTFFGAVPEWARLLLWPARLSADYSPQQVRIPLVWHVGLLPGAAMCLALLLAAAVAWSRRERVVLLGLGWVVIASSLASGLLVKTGVLMAERMFFLPSVGVAVLAGWGMARLEATSSPRADSWRRAALAAAAVLVVAGAVRSAARGPVWKDNRTLFYHMPEDAPLSYKAHWAFGKQLFDDGKPAEGEQEILLAIRLFPMQPAVHYDLAERYRTHGMCRPAIPHYRHALALRADRLPFWLGLARCYIDTDHPDSAITVLRAVPAELAGDASIVRLTAAAREANDAHARPAPAASLP